MGVDVLVGMGVKVNVDVGVGEAMNAARRIVGAAIRLNTIAPKIHPITTPTPIAIISCRRGSSTVMSGDYNIACRLPKISTHN